MSKAPLAAACADCSVPSSRRVRRLGPAARGPTGVRTRLRHRNDGRCRSVQREGPWRVSVAGPCVPLSARASLPAGTRIDFAVGADARLRRLAADLDVEAALRPLTVALDDLGAAAEAAGEAPADSPSAGRDRRDAPAERRRSAGLERAGTPTCRHRPSCPGRRRRSRPDASATRGRCVSSRRAKAAAPASPSPAISIVAARLGILFSLSFLTTSLSSASSASACLAGKRVADRDSVGPVRVVGVLAVAAAPAAGGEERERQRDGRAGRRSAFRGSRPPGHSGANIPRDRVGARRLADARDRRSQTFIEARVSCSAGRDGSRLACVPAVSYAVPRKVPSGCLLPCFPGRTRRDGPNGRRPSVASHEERPRGDRRHDDLDGQDDRVRDPPAVPVWRRVHPAVPLRAEAVLVSRCSSPRSRSATARPGCRRRTSSSCSARWTGWAASSCWPRSASSRRS